ncbi:MAG: nitroreductase family protein [Candidatus Hodarchaeota archaeon]
MEFYDVIEKRKSFRKFKPDLVSMDTIKRILNAARLAPTWANMQGVKFIVVNDKETAEKVGIAVGQKWAQYCPMFIVAINKASSSGMNSGLKYFMLDVGIVFEHVMLAATAEGLGTCWIGHFSEDEIKKILSIPGKYRVVALTPLGYPSDPAKETSRKPLSSMVHVNKYGEKLEN